MAIRTKEKVPERFGHGRQTKNGGNIKKKKWRFRETDCKKSDGKGRKKKQTERKRERRKRRRKGVHFCLQGLVIPMINKPSDDITSCDGPTHRILSLSSSWCQGLADWVAYMSLITSVYWQLT